MQSPPPGESPGRSRLHRFNTTTPVAAVQDSKRSEAIFDEYAGYKRKRAMHVVFVTLILIMVFIQVCFAVRIYRAVEKKWVHAVQSSLNVNVRPVLFLERLSMVDSEHVNVGIMMAIFTFMYGYDYMIGMGVLCKYLLGMIVFKFISVAMREPRPYWIDSLGPHDEGTDVVGYTCDSTFAMPDLAVIQLFWFLINFQDIISKSQIKISMIIDKVFIWGSVLLLLLLIVVKYVSGEMFILQVAMSLLLGFIFLQASKYLTAYLRKAIERCTVGASLERKFIIRYYVFLMLIAILDIILMITNDSYDHKQLKYIENLINCKVFFDKKDEITKIDPVKSIGLFPTFMRATYFAYMFGAIIGATFAFSNTDSPLTWFHNAKKNKWKKIAIVNIWIVAIGIGMYYIDLQALSVFERFGVNSYYVKIVLSFIFSFVATGVLPEYIFNSFDQRHHHSMGLGSTFFEFSPNSLPSGHFKKKF